MKTVSNDFQSSILKYVAGWFILVLPTEWLKLLKWLNSATSKDPARPSLQVIHVQETSIEASNGFMIFMVKFEKPENQVLPIGDFKIISITRTYAIFEELPENKYPNSENVWPKTLAIKPKETSDRYSVYMNMDPKFLLKALGSIPSHMVKIQLSPGPVLITIPVEPGNFDSIGVTSIQSLIMPMLSSDGASGIVAVKDEGGEAVVQRDGWLVEPGGSEEGRHS